MHLTLRLLIFSAVAALLHDLLIRCTELSLARSELYEIYVLLLILSLLVYMAVHCVARKSFDRAGFAYMGASLLKMMAFVVYLLPLLRTEKPPDKPVIVQYLAVYLLFLIVEAAAVFKLLKDQRSNEEAKGPKE